jgi:arylsulfatase A-like enzyme
LKGLVCVMNKKPNILFILSDQHRYDCIGFSNAFPVQTPNIDRLATEGMWFENAFTPIPLCCPARQALLNGRRPEAFGGLWNYDIALKIAALEPHEYSWPRELKNLGYKNGYVGKWHVNPEHTPLEYGFDAYVSEYDYLEFRQAQYSHLGSNGFYEEVDLVPLEHSGTHWLADQAVNLIEQYTCEGSPWHIRLDFPQPHLPCRPVEEFACMYHPHDIPMWGSFIEEFIRKPYIQKQQLYNWGIENYTWEDWASIVARYYGIISQMDDAIGSVFNKLDELGIADETIVIYSSDHGDMCGSHRMMDKHYVLYDDIVRVPLIIRWPGKIKGSSRCNKFVYNCLDLAPTILGILGLEQKEFFSGRSLVPLLKGEQAVDWRKEVVSTYNGQQFGLYTQRMIRNNKWKYIWNTTDIDELYNLEEDPWELNNLIEENKYAGVVSELRKKLCKELLESGDGLLRSPWMSHQLLNNRKLTRASEDKATT